MNPRAHNPASLFQQQRIISTIVKRDCRLHSDYEIICLCFLCDPTDRLRLSLPDNLLRLKLKFKLPKSATKSNRKADRFLCWIAQASTATCTTSQSESS